MQNPDYDYIDELRKLKTLFDEGIITEDEFVMLKKKLLGIEVDDKQSINAESMVSTDSFTNEEDDDTDGSGMSDFISEMMRPMRETEEKMRNLLGDSLEDFLSNLAAGDETLDEIAGVISMVNREAMPYAIADAEYSALSQDEKMYLKSIARDNSDTLLHFSYGVDLRNKYNLWQFEDADGISLEILNLIVQKAIDDKTLEIVTKEVDCVHELIEAKEKLYYDDSVENIRSFANAILNCERSNSSVPTYFQTKNDAKPLVITDKGNRYFAIALDTEKAKSQKEAVDINMDIHYVLSLLFFNHNYDGIVIDPFSPVAMYLSKDFMLKVLVHGKYPDQHNGGVSEKNWGYGIPDYSADDLMTQGELLNFAMHLVIDHDLEKNGYRIVSACDNTNAVANIVAEKSGEYHLIAVTGYCAAETPVLSIERKLELLNLGDKYNAHCYYAPVGFRSATDLIRFNKCLALKGDGFYSKYEGLERIQ